MRFIRKGVEPESFKRWKASSNDYWTPTYATLSNPEKGDVYTALLEEQGFICCYCERELIPENNDYHIEHLTPQSAQNGDELDFNNFLSSCMRTTVKGDPLHCGMKKGDNVLPITPLQADCRQNFIFTADGKIDGVNAQAKQTIQILALDISRLNDLREKALEAFLDPDLNNQELQEFVKKYLEKGQKFEPFVSAVAHIFSDYIQG